MTKEAQLKQIVEESREQEIIPFLKECSLQERKAIVPTLKKLSRYFNELVEVQPGAWGGRGNLHQSHILKYAQFVCYNRKEFEAAGSWWAIDPKFLDPILPWHCPSWFSDFVNATATGETLPIYLSYDFLLRLQEQGYLQPEPRLIARVLAKWIFEHVDRGYRYAPEKLLQHLATLDEHIWHMFRTESDIHSAHRWIFIEGNRASKGWLEALRDHCANGCINRRQLLEETMLAANRNFNKNMSGWFIDLLEALNPTKDELSDLQDALFNMFSSPHSRVVNAALMACKDMLDQHVLPITIFLDHVPIMAASKTKATVALVLQLMEKIVKTDMQYASEVARLAASVFIHKDDALQSRAAKLIASCGDVNDTALREALAHGKESMLSGPRKTLKAYLEEGPAKVPIVKTNVRDTKLSDMEALVPVKDIDEWIFLATQITDNNKPWHIDQFLEASVRFFDKVQGSDLEKMAPAVQRALRCFVESWRSNRGQLDIMLAKLYLDMVSLLALRFPEDQGTIAKLYGRELGKSEQGKRVWANQGFKARFFNDPNGSLSFIYEPWQLFMKGVLNDIRESRERVVLSTPTHAPYWIDPLVLVDRLRECQQKQLIVEPMDMQIAMSRCWLKEPGEAKAKAAAVLDGEWRRIMLFLLDPASRPEGPFTMDYAWMMAALVKSPDTEFPELSVLPYHKKPRAVFTGQYAWKAIMEEVTIPRTVLRDGAFVEVASKSNVKRISEDMKETHPGEGALLPEYMNMTLSYLNWEDKDISRIFSLMPSHPDPLMAAMLDKCLHTDPIFGDEVKRVLIAHLRAVHEARPRFGRIGHVYLAASLLCSDKTAASTAVEIWIQGVDTIDHRLLGSMLGKIQAIEFAPMKRFTDLVLAKMMGVSNQCDAALSAVLSVMIGELPVAGVKGQKKLEGILKEVGGRE